MKIPQDRLRIRYVRSGGPGGQNVNKVATKADVRFRVADADWIPGPWRERLRQQQARRINSRGELVIVSSRYRTRQRNLEDCLEKLARLLERARKLPKKRRNTRPTAASKERRLETKRQRSKLKRGRRGDPADD